MGIYWKSGSENRKFVDGWRDSNPSPFAMENLSGDPARTILRTGMDGRLAHRTSRSSKKLRVISSTSVVQYRPRQKPGREIAQELNVGTPLWKAAVLRLADR